MHPRRILVATHRRSEIESLKKALIRAPYQLLLAGDGETAIKRLETPECPIALAIIDLDLPVVSGLEVICRVVTQSPPSPTKIIAITPDKMELPNGIVAVRGVDLALHGHAILVDRVFDHKWSCDRISL